MQPAPPEFVPPLDPQVLTWVHRSPDIEAQPASVDELVYQGLAYVRENRRPNEDDRRFIYAALDSARVAAGLDLGHVGLRYDSRAGRSQIVGERSLIYIGPDALKEGYTGIVREIVRRRTQVTVLDEHMRLYGDVPVHPDVLHTFEALGYQAVLQQSRAIGLSREASKQLRSALNAELAALDEETRRAYFLGNYMLEDL